MKCKQNGELAKRYHAVTLTIIIVGGAVLVATMPTAAAHTCAAYSGCDASSCKDGEDHDHTDFNYIEKDEHCESHVKKQDEPGCTYNGVRVPGPVCKIINGSIDTGKVTQLPSSPPGCQPKSKPDFDRPAALSFALLLFSAVKDPSTGCGTASQVNSFGMDTGISGAFHAEGGRGHIASARLDWFA